MEEEVHCANAKEDPVVETVLEHVEERHGVVRESVNEKGFEFSFQVMNEDHGEPNFLAEVVLEGLAIDLLLKYYEKCGNKHWTKVLNKEHKLPRNLQAQVLKNKSDWLSSLKVFWCKEFSKSSSFI